MADWYRMGDLFVSASTSETQGLTYIEALASGVPALCRADPCLEGVIQEGENGWQYHSSTDFREKLDNFLAHPEERSARRKAAMESVKQFSAEHFAAHMESIYCQQIVRRSAVSEKGVSA